MALLKSPVGGVLPLEGRVFIARDGRPLKKRGAEQILERLAKKAGVAGYGTHFIPSGTLVARFICKVGMPSPSSVPWGMQALRPADLRPHAGEAPEGGDASLLAGGPDGTVRGKILRAA